MSNLQRPKNITANGTTVVSLVPCRLLWITINTKGASANVATVYDNTAGSGSKIGTIDTVNNGGTLWYDVDCDTGLTIVTATGTCADLTVVTAPYQRNDNP
jgi:predicted transglutaminase-like protease